MNFSNKFILFFSILVLFAASGYGIYYDEGKEVNAEHFKDKPGKKVETDASYVPDMAFNRFGSFSFLVDYILPSCFDSANGMAWVDTIWGSDLKPPFTYEWFFEGSPIPGETNDTIEDLQNGNYFCRVTDNEGTRRTRPFTLNTQPIFINDAIPEDVSCYGANDGTIDIDALGGTGALSYSIDSGYTYFPSNFFIDQGPGDYYIFVQDANLCVKEYDFEYVTITQPDTLVITLDTAIHLTCNNSGDGAIEVSVDGGTGPYSYSWSHGPTVDDVYNLDAGTYTLTVTDPNGCTDTLSVTITEPDPLLISNIVVKHITCKGDGDGAISVDVNGGTLPYSYKWSHGPITEDVANLGPGSYKLVVTDANSCTDSIEPPITILEPTTISIAHSETHVNCKGGNDGSIDIEPSGGTPGFTYSWDHGPTTQDVSTLTAGPYTVTVTDANGCFQDSTITITEPAVGISIGHSETPVTCNGGNDGAIDITPAGGTPGYTYQWGHGPTTQDVSGLSKGAYTVRVTDANGCFLDSTINVTEPTAISIGHAESHVTCFGLTNGSIDITPAGGTPGYTYSWDHGPSTQDVSGLGADFYTVTVTDANGCFQDSTIEITQPATISIPHTEIHVSCNGGGNGSIDISPAGGTAPYTFSWDHGPTTEDVGGLSAGFYTVTVTDANTCSQDSTIEITEPTSISITHSEIHVSCKGGNDGSIDIEPSGGTPGFTYSWDHGPTTQDVSTLTAGPYTVTVTDANGCFQDSTITITEPAAGISIGHSETPVTCNGGNDGAIDITPAGGTPGYTFQWGHGPTTQDVSGLSAGPYTVRVTDANGCFVDSTINVTEPTAISIGHAESHVTCFGLTNGSIDITPAGGTPGYTYSWDHGPTTQDVSGLGAGFYTVTVTDANGCFQDSTIEITQPATISIPHTEIHVSCNGGGNGSIDISPAGGTAPYTFSWDHGPTTEDVGGLSAGFYTVTVTDVNTCSQDSTIEITEPTTISIAHVETHVSCFGGNNGSIDITPSGGTPGYTYSWDHGPTTQDVSGLTAGPYTITVTDNNGCTQDSTITITEPLLPLSVDADSIKHVTCSGKTDGAIYVTPEGGTLPYDFDWDGPGIFDSDQEDIEDLAAGIYDLRLEDANGCVVLLTDTVTQPDPITYLIDSIKHVTCYRAANGSIGISTSGGIKPYIYDWTDLDSFVDSTEDISDLDTGNYYLVITDSNACSINLGPLTITEPEELVITAVDTTHISCFDKKDGAISVNTSGGTLPYSWYWDGPGTYTSNLESIADLDSGDYECIVTDAKNCSDTLLAITINEPTEIVINTDSVKDVSCNGGNDGVVYVSVSGGVPGYTYAWAGTGIPDPTAQDITNLFAGNYTLTVTDTTGCSVIHGTETVDQPTALVVKLDSSKDITCYGDSNGVIYITASEGTAPYTYSWTNDSATYSSTSEDIINLGPANYSVRVTDSLGCFFDLGPIPIIEPAILDVTLDSFNHISCYDAGDGRIFVDVTGGTTPYSYVWTGPGGPYTTQDIIGLEKGDYDLVVTDNNSCTDTLPTQTINEPDSIGVVIESATSKLLLDCKDDNDGSIDITVSGGTGPFTFNWTGPSFSDTTEDITGLLAGIYNLTVYDAEGCSRDYLPLDTIKEPDVLSVSLVKSDILCFNDNNGTITAIATGGTRPYRYSKNDITYFPDSVFSNLLPIQYTIYVLDTNDCKDSDTLTIYQPGEISIAKEEHDAGNKCFGDSNAVITIVAEGGVAPLKYSIDSGYTYSTDTVFPGLPAGEYPLFVMDTNGCIEKGSTLLIDHPAEIKISSYTQVDIESCFTSPEGKISIETTGGVTPIDFVLDGSETNQSGNFYNVSAGPHVISIIDANSCSKDTNVVINSPPPIVIDSIYIEHILGCYGDSTGVIYLQASGGTGDLDYSLNFGVFDTIASYSGLPGGDHTITIKDSNDCEIDTIITINQPDTIGTSSVIVTPVTCMGDSNGVITVTGSGGTSPYTYTLFPGASSDTTGIFTGLSPGDYTVTVDDDNGCPTYTTPLLTVAEPTLLSLDSVRYKRITCYGTDDGEISMYPSGGFAPYYYSVNNGVSFDSVNIISGLAPDTYYVLVEDSGGCQVRGDTITLTQPEEIKIDSSSATDVSTCYGDSTGTVNVYASGGSGTLLYSIDTINWQATGNFLNLPGGDYTVRVADTSGCYVTSNPVTISGPPPIVADITTLSSINGEPGAIFISASGGTGELVYSMKGPVGPYQPDTAFLEAWPGDHRVVVKDENGCLYEEIVTVLADPPLEINVSYSGNACYGDSAGSIFLISVNGTEPVLYSIDDSSTFQTEGNYTNLTGGTYIIFVKDADRRIYKDTIVVTEPPELVVIPDITPSTCSKYTFDGSITLDVSGGTPGYTFLWSNDSTTKDIYSLEEGFYSITITDAVSCQFNDTYEVTANVSITADAGNDTSVCIGEQVILNGSGGITYFWQPEAGLNNPGIANPVTTVTDSATYVLTVLEPGGCYDRDTVVLSIHPILGIDAGNDTTVAPGQSIQLGGVGGAFVSYSWMPVEGLDDPASQYPNLLVSQAQTYYVTGVTAQGCIETDSVIISTAGNLIIYSGFTPNDDGINDKWDIDYVQYYPNITIEVYNRWGSQVFSSKGYSSEQRWDGKYKGKDVPIGTYYYIINLNDGSKPLRGHVTIVR